MANQTQWQGVKFRVGDVVRVHLRIKEEDRIRTQIFEGVVIAIRGREDNKSFTVRKISFDSIGVERIWPLNSPWIKKIVIKKKASDVHRAKLYYLRQGVHK